jgi:hypothetical protein
LSDPAALALVARALAAQQATADDSPETLVVAADEARTRRERSERLLDAFDAAGRLLALSLTPA